MSKKAWAGCFLMSMVLQTGPLFAADTDDEDADTPNQAASDQADKPEKTKKKKKDEEAKGFRFEFKNHPSIRAGDWLRIDFRVKFQHDFRAFDPEFNGDEGETSNLKRLRVGIEGYITKDFEYAVEREIRNEVADALSLRTRETGALWRDVYGNYRHFKSYQIRVGQFKIPLGFDQLNGTTNGEFIFRSLIGTHLAPGRAIGTMLHGKFLEGKLAYQAGAFLSDGHRSHLQDGSVPGERTFSGRIVTPPFQWFTPPGPLKMFKSMEVGAAFTETAVHEGLNSLRGRTWYATHNYFDRVNVRGHRLRLGTEFSWTPGPFSVRAEYIHVRDERLGQSLRGDDLPNLISQGWYVSTSWVLTGEKKEDKVVPKHPVHWGKGFGAFEIAARDEQIRFGSAEHIGTPSRSSRASNIYETSERAASFGVNWYLNRWMRINFNGVREVVEDPQNTPIKGVDTYWSKIVRMQFVL